MRSRSSYVGIITLVLASLAGGAVMAQAQKEEVTGIRNFTKIDATIACAGATEDAAMPLLAERGYTSVINLRLPTEDGVDIEVSTAAAEAAGLKYIHLPFSGSAPDPKIADAFIAAVTDAANQPVFIHCGTANRVGALWLAKRMLVDKWDQARALEEAKLIGLTSEALERFALEFVRSKGALSAAMVMVVADIDGAVGGVARPVSDVTCRRTRFGPGGSGPVSDCWCGREDSNLHDLAATSS